MKRILILLSLFINIALVSIFAYKIYNNWFESAVLKLPFRTSIFNAAPKTEGLIYFIGDSHTEAFELNEYLDNSKVRNRGVWGDVTIGVLKRIDSIVNLKPSKVFLLIGVNDILSGVSVNKAYNNMTEIVNKIKTKSPSTSIYIQSVLPTNNKIFRSNSSATVSVIILNQKYKLLADNKKVKFVDLYSSFEEKGGLKKEYSFDGLHLTGQGYLAWSSLIKQYLN
jgi:lysophospholipase L1-like esterase